MHNIKPRVSTGAAQSEVKVLCAEIPEEFVISLPMTGQWTAVPQSVHVLLSTQNLTIHQHGEHQGQNLYNTDTHSEHQD